MAQDNLVKMMTFILIGMLLSSVATATSLEVTGASTDTNTLTGGTTSTYTATSGGGGGGGGGGGLSGESFSNVEVNEKYYLYIYDDQVTSYRFINTSNPVLFVNISGNTNPGEVRVSVEVLKDKSTLVKERAPGMVYKYANIWVGTSGFAVPKNIKEAAIKFRVENRWMRSNGFSPGDIKMFKWDGNSWIMLEIDAKGTDETYSFFEGRTDSFSSFAMSGLKSTYVPITSKPATDITAMAVTTPSPATTHSEKSPGFEFILVIIAFSTFCYRK